MKYNQFGEVVSVNGLTVGQHLGTPMQDALGSAEDNAQYAIAKQTVTRNKNVIEDEQPTMVLPQHLQFGGVEVEYSDTLTWDGNTDGLANCDGVLWKVSDIVLTAEDLSNGVSGVTDTGFCEFIVTPMDGIVMGGTDYFGMFFASVATDGLDLDGMIFPEKGLYFVNFDDGMGGYVLSSLTINGYNGFTTKTIKPIDVKYLPMDAIVEAVKASL